MNFGKQLKLLLWKNFILRKRQPVRFFIEITWPIVLLALLALVRTKNLQDTIPECHFYEKALPSAGCIPFLQSYICTFNNTCRQNSTDDNPGQVNIFHDSILSQLFKILDEVFRNDTLQAAMGQTVEDAGQLLRSSQDLSGRTRLVPENNLRFRDVFPVNITNFPTGPLSSANSALLNGLLNAQFRQFLVSDILQTITGNQLFCDVAVMKKVLTFDSTVDVPALAKLLCTVPASSWIAFLTPAADVNRMHSSFKMSGTDDMFAFDLMSTYFKFQSLKTSAAKLTPMRSALTDIQTAYTSTNTTGIQFIGKFICGSHDEIFNVEDASSQHNRPLDVFRHDREPTRSDTRRRTPRNILAKALQSNNSAEYCKNIFEYFETTTKIAIRFLWKPLKSYVLGKLLYTPDTPATRKLVKRMNQTFESLEGVIWAGKEFVRLVPEVKLILDAMLKANMSAPSGGGGYTSTGGLMSVLSDFMGSGLGAGGLAGLASNRSALQMFRDQLDSTASVVGNITQFLSCIDLDKFVPLPTETDLDHRGMQLVNNGTFWAGIVFESLSSKASHDAAEIPPFMRYKIRYDIDKVDSTIRVKDRFWRPNPRRQPLTDLKYWTYGFSVLQDMTERALMAEMLHLNTTDSFPGIYLQQFPYPCFIEDSFFMAISRNFPLIMTLAWVYTAAMMVKSIVYEKEKRLKETMLMMGLRNSANRFAWFLEAFITMHISIFFMVIILNQGSILRHSNWIIIYIFLLAFCLSTISFSFFLGVFFSKANIAAAAGGFLFFTSFIPYSLLILWEDRLTIAMKIATCLIPNVAFGWGSNVFARREEQGMGVQFSNMRQSVLDADRFTLLHSIVMLLIDSVLLFILTWYLEAVMPGQYGIARPWYFPLTGSYWCGSNKRSTRSDSEDDETMDVNTRSDANTDFEPEPSHATKGVTIRDLRKVYHNGKIAIDGLSLNVFEGITSLLGHNGAGKTTTFSILCGLFPATSGTAKIYGYDVQTEMDRIRESFGFCPQHNVLWDDLTVEEHLFFYASLKIDSKKAVKAEIDAMIDSVGLPDKRNEQTKNLSGGMQRKLSVAIAYVGGAKVVLLDEPTAGVDPWARRGIWNLLIRFRKDRTTIMSTHFHGEADTLSDRIAVIADGKLICAGSPVFLKKRFGSGYYLTLVKSSLATDEAEVGDFIRKYIPSVRLVENVGSELAYILPTILVEEGSFALLFEGLDANLGYLELTSYGIRDTSLEEVFLRVMEKHDQSKPPEEEPDLCVEEGFLTRFRRRQRFTTAVADGPLDNSIPYTASGCNIVSPPLDDWAKISNSIKRVKGAGLHWQQMKALHVKRFHNMRRSKKSFACEIILPAFFVCLAMVVTQLVPSPQEQPPLELTPWLYGPPNYIFFTNNDTATNTSSLLQGLYDGPGIGPRCVKGNPVKGKTCTSIRKDLSHLIPHYPVSSNATAECDCASGGDQCPENAGGPVPPCMLLNTTDWLCNMTGRNMTDWLTKTAKQYDNNRYGGFSLGEIDTFGDFNFTHWTDSAQEMFTRANLTGIVSTGFVTNWPKFLQLLSGMFQRENVRVWFNNRGWASSPAYVNAINNVILRSQLAPGTDPYDYGILVVNHPISRTEEQMEGQIMRESAKALMHAVCVIFAMSFVPASFIMFLIEERISGAKNLQFTSKVKPWLYWVSTYMYDIGNYLLTTAICVCIFLAFNEQAYVSKANCPALIALLALYGFAAIPMMYIPSFYFKVPSSAFVALACLNLFLGIVSTITVFILELLNDESLQEIAAVLRKVFLVLPHYCLGRGLMDLAINNVKARVFAQFGQTIEDHPFDWTFVGRNVFYLCIQGVLFFLLTLLIEYNFFLRKRKHEPQVHVTSSIIEDRDVADERARVFNGNADESVLKVEDLSQTFRQRKGVHHAVDKISFAIGKSECFGLLGVNGAGKSTTFKMLTGNLTATSGDAFVNKHSVVSNLDGARQHIGYCPQFDAINQLLTGREHLQFYARIHGIPERYVRQAAERGIQHMQLSAYANRSAGGYSGGNKRKLSTAIALIGDPDIVFLDEPTTGMDPKARRFLWNCILTMIREGRSVVITSHSLEECENLCTKLAIMVNGRFQCFGSLQHLKSRFGFGYTVIIRCAPTSMSEVCQFMETTFRKARLQEKHYNTVQYRIPIRSVKLSRIFSAIEDNRDRLQIEDSSVNQTNLEDIFIEFAKHQTDLPTEKVSEPAVVDEPAHASLHEYPTYIDTRTFDSVSMTSSMGASRATSPVQRPYVDSGDDDVLFFNDIDKQRLIGSSPV